MIREEELKILHDLWMKEQERLEPVLTFERMGELAGGLDRWAVRHRLKLMQERGMVTPVKFGLRTRYRIEKP